MTLERIRLFILSAKHRNITQAARELHISQSAASRQLKRLEEKLATKLFKKNGRGRKLTRSGQAFLNEVSPLWSQFEELEKKYSRSADSITIAATHRPSKYLIPALITRFSNNHPAAKLTLLTRSSFEIEKLLIDETVDLAIITNPTSSMSSFVTEPYYRESLTAFVAANHPLAHIRSLGATADGTIPLIVKCRRDGQSRVEQQLQGFEKQGMKFKVVMRCESPEVVKEFVRQGAGVGLLYLNSIRQGIERGAFKTLQLPALDIVGQIYIVYSKEKPLTRLARELLLFLRMSVTGAGLVKPLVSQISNAHQNGQPRDNMLRSKLLSVIIVIASLDWTGWLLA